MHRKRSSANRVQQAGISYIEVLIAIAILAISLVPAMEALSTAQLGSRINADLQRQHYKMLGKYESMLSMPFSELDAEAQLLADENTPSTLYSDNASTPDRRLVYLQRYDADNIDGDNDVFTGGDEHILWLKVEVAGSTIAQETLVSGL
ncbi:MAG: hypothetical protein AB8B86_10050 [Pseudomonadales bacterium]